MTLLDADAVIYAHEQGVFPTLLEGNTLGVSPQVVREADFFLGASGRVQITLTTYFDAGQLRLEEATLAEVRTFTIQCPRSGLGAGETESLAIVLSRTVGFCTGDRRAMRVMHLLGVGACWCSLAQLYSNSGLDGAAIEQRWQTTAWTWS